VRLPTVNDVLRAGTEQVEALAALPRSIVVFNRALANFAETVAVLDQLVRRLDRLTGPLEGPLTALAPRLEALVPLLDEDVIHSLPTVLDSVERNAVPALELMGTTREQLASVAASIERLLAGMEEGFARLQDLPGAFLVSRLRGSGRTTRAASGTAPTREAGPLREAGPGGGTAPVSEPTPPSGPAPRSDPGLPVGPPASGGAATPAAPPPSRTSGTTEEHRSWRA
jgi:hypothetical protein